MQFRQLGSTEIEASAIALGTWAIGGWMWGGSDDAAAIRTIQTALDAGITTVDTAPIYGFGRSEEIVGRAIRGRRRDSIIIASKCGIPWDTKPFPPGVGEFHCFADDVGLSDEPSKYYLYRCLRPDVIRRGVEDSLRRLGTDCIDLMQIHHVGDSTTPIGEAVGILEDLRWEGKIRAVGISNATRSQLDAYCAAGQIDVAQERFSALDRTVEKNGVLDACRERGVSFLAYSPLENGLLTGRLDPERVYGAGDFRADNPKFAKANVERVNAALAQASGIAKRLDLNVSQLAAAWVASRYDKAVVLWGARTPEQALEAAGAGDAKLSADDFEEFDDILDSFGVKFD